MKSMLEFHSYDLTKFVFLANGLEYRGTINEFVLSIAKIIWNPFNNE